MCCLGKINVDIEEFKRLYADGMTDKEIANVLGFSINTARKIRFNLGLSPLVRGRKPTVTVVIDDEELKSLCEKGLSDKEIGSFFGVSVYTIFNHRQRLGLSKWKKWEKTASNIEKFRRLHAEGLNDRKIGNIFGICIDTARKIRNDLGLPPQPLNRKHIDPDELKCHLSKGLTDEEIGAIFGVSAYTVYERRRDLGLFRQKKKIRFENINIADFKKLYTEGMSDKEIGKALKVQDLELIREVRRQLGLAPNQGRFHKRKRELYDAGMSDGQIASIIKGSKKSVAAWRRNHGLPPNKSDENKTIQLDSESLICNEYFENHVDKATTKKTIVPRHTLKKINNDELKKLFTEGLSDTEIGKYFGVCDRTISNRRRLLGLYRQKPRIRREDIDIEGFRQLYLVGMSDVEICKALDIPQSAIFRIRHNLGLAPNRGRRHWDMRELYDLGLSDSKIAEILKMRKHNVTIWRQSHKLPGNNNGDTITDVHDIKLIKLEEEPIQMDSESLFFDTKFLEIFFGKNIKGNF